MKKTLEGQIFELEQAIRAQESLRESLADVVVDATIAALREKVATLRSTIANERKLVSSLFCDIVGSTRMAAERDPEEVLQIIDGALREMSAAVEQFGGYVARYQGDGILAFFGAPHALEDHAEQAIRAGLEIQARMADYEEQVKRDHGLVEFRARVGINSGYVVAGHIAGAQGEYTVIGDAVNVASRLESAAPPGGVLVGESTFRLAKADTLFEVQPWGEVEVKGETEPLRVYQILHYMPQAPGRIAAVGRSRLAGRGQELKLLKQGYTEVAALKQPKVIALVGEAGIGKSRLRQEFTSWLREDFPQARLWLGRAFSYTGQTPYALAGSLLRGALEILETDNADRRREKLERGWTAAGDLTTEQLHSLAAILALEYPESSLSSFEPQARRYAISDAFKAYASGVARLGGLVLVFEDTHWADGVSLDLIENLVKEASGVPLFGLLLIRPSASTTDRLPDLRSRIGAEKYSEIQLGYLTREHTSEMICSLLSAPSIAADIVETIVRITQGNPFFVEEMLSSFIEDGTLITENGDWRLSSSLAEIQVPDTVQGVLAARIDRLEPELKSVLQHAAIIGRTFWQRLLTALLQKNVGSHLSRLEEQEFVERHGPAAVVQDWEWIFRHVLVQEVAYESVLKESRRALHREIAQWLEEHGSDRLEELAPTLARHYEQGQMWDKAIGHLARAADRSKDLFALTEALSFLDRAIALTLENPGAVDRQTELRLHESRGEVRGLEGDFEGAVTDLGKVVRAAQQEGNKPWEQQLQVGLGMVFRRADDYDNAMAHLTQALDVARSIGDRHGMADALYHLGSVAWSQGNNVRSTTYHQEALEICREMQLRDLVAVQALHGRGEAFWFSGQPRRAIELFTESLELAAKIGDKSYQSENLQMIGFMHVGWFGVADYGVARARATESLAISQEAHLDWHTVPALLTLAQAVQGLGDYQAALELIIQANEQAEAIGSLRMVSIGLGNQGCVYQDLNLVEMAHAAHLRGVQVARQIHSNLWLPRLQADLAIDRLRQGDLEVGPQLHEALVEARTRDQIAHATRCLEGLAELSLAKSDPEATIGHAAELLAVAEAGGMREQIAKAYLWRGKAFHSANSLESAEENLQQAANLAAQIESPRLTWDIHTSLADLCAAQGKGDLAAKSAETVRGIVRGISANLKDAELRKGLPDV